MTTPAGPTADAPAGPGCSCVPPLTPLADQFATLRELVATEPEPLVTVTHLLRLCRDEHPTLWEHHADPRGRARVARVVARVAGSLAEPGTEVLLSPLARGALAEALASTGGLPVVVVAHALAELLDERYGHAFTGWFRERSPYQPAVGDPIPLDSPNLRRLTELAPTAPPWRLANRLDETRRVRLAGGWATQFRVVFDYAAFEALTGLIDGDTVIATCHPNRDLAEFDLPAERCTPAFPVGPRDPAAQAARVDAVLRRAAAAGATVVVLPELSMTETLARQLERWVRDPGPVRLLVTGSFHHTSSSEPGRRSNRALAWVRDHSAPLLQDKHSPADQPVTEDISPLGWPEIRIHPTADGWHLVIAVCRDLLNPHAVHALSEAGANLVLAPAMSETLVAFGGPVAQLVGTGQAVVVVANGPGEWSDPDRPEHPARPARALFGHPGFAQQTRQVQAPDARPGIALLRVRTGRLAWQPAEISLADPRTPATSDPVPPWALRLPATRRARAGAGAAEPVTLREAAVLVVLTGGHHGPEVLLTSRASDLTHYAGQLVFPGGAAEASDRGPEDTALREAGEEIGLDRASVQVLGTLPAFALPDSGFAVTPVLAWASRPRFTHAPNPAEVSSVHTVPLVPRTGGSAGQGPDVPESDGGIGDVGVMTAAVLDLLRGGLARQGPLHRAEPGPAWLSP